jgi:hypothetical protein
MTWELQVFVTQKSGEVKMVDRLRRRCSGAASRPYAVGAQLKLRLTHFTREQLTGLQ